MGFTLSTHDMGLDQTHSQPVSPPHPADKGPDSGVVFPPNCRIVLIDRDLLHLFDELQSLISNNARQIPMLLVAQSDESGGEIPNCLWEKCSDIIDKSLTLRDLTKRLELYQSYLGFYEFANDNSDIFQLRQQNHKLLNHISTLENQVNKIDSDLLIHSEVIDKVNRISILSRRINSLDLGRIAQVCIDEIPELISARFASLYQYDAEKKELYLLSHNHPYSIDHKVVLAEHIDSPMDLAIRHRKLLLIEDLPEWADQEDKLVNRLYARNYDSNSCIIAPLMSGNKVLGVLNLADHGEGHPFDHVSDGPPVELICEIIGSAMANIKLYEEVRHKARTDSMTGLVNHQTFYDELDKEVMRSKRYGGSLSLIIIDLDNLKHINDHYGHRVGDAVLLHVAEQITHCTRTNDIAARYGGDEFTIILPNTSVGEALVVAGRIGKMVSELAVAYEDDSYYASVSIGVGQYRTGSTLDEFMNEADTALFEAKSSGKNKVQVFEAAAK
ncbi:MAG: sensor domain-containing diguanylate cyclase [Planctomycetes bacterium]|nr:sensor domain-containing diguanylate cyclase [Planctomycetota bacterium]